MNKNSFVIMLFVGIAGCSGDDFSASPAATPDAQTDAPDAPKESSDGAKPDAAHEAGPKTDAGNEADALKDLNGPEAIAADAAEEATVGADAAGVDAAPEASLPETSIPIAPGDLIKDATSGVHYFGEDFKRHLFPNENTFYSWLTVNDFNLAKTLPDAELAAIPAGKDVTIRPGTYLVKIQSDVKSYAVTNCGHLHWIGSEAIIAALYGADWATHIVDVPDSIFGQYTVSTPITAPIHPDGQVIAYGGDPNRYVVMNGAKRKIVGAAFTANRWQEAFVVTTTIPYADGVDVTGSEPNNFWSVACP